MTARYLQANQPDILEVIANLSNDAVFTPPKVANAVLDLLPDEVWSDPKLRWLDPCSKTGVFPREITKRLMVGLQGVITDDADRLNHILTNMVFAIATEEITAMMSRRSLYCSKDASSNHSAVRFPTKAGNVWHQRVEHNFDNDGKCSECKGSKDQLEVAGRDNKAYAFIHATGFSQLEKEVDMKFDVIVGNPPYQMDAEGGNRTIPLYNIFFGEAKKLNPRFIAMIIPSRWMTSGLGLGDFRAEMLADKRIQKLVDFAKMDAVFPGVDFEGGVCYFLWNRDTRGPCEVTYVQNDLAIGPSERDLDELDILVRDPRALPILHKVLATRESPLTDVLAVDKEFGMTSNFSGFSKIKKPSSIAVYYNDNGKRFRGWMNRADVPKSSHLIDTWKVLIPQAYGERGAIPAQVLGPTQIVGPPSVCTQTYLFVHVGTEEHAKNVEAYVKTRFVRFLISLRKTTQHATKSTYTWVPQQDWNQTWTEVDLYKKYGITDDEQNLIESIVRASAR